VVALAALLSSGCESRGDVPHAQLLTTADLEALVNNPDAPRTIVEGYGLPGGMRLDRIIKIEGGVPQLVKRDTFTHGYKSAYVTTEVWAGFDEVWVQPAYVAVKDYPAGAAPARLTGVSGKWRPIFGVGPDSAFYSSFWQTIYFRIPDQDDVDTFNSVRDVFARGFDLRPAEGRVMALAPDTVDVPPRQEMKDGLDGVGGPSKGGVGVYDGQPQPFLDFGTGTFDFETDLVVEEVPLYVWVARDANGELQTLDMPTVGGSGPPYSGREPLVVDGKPKYGSYWRIYTVEMQPGWKVFVPPDFSEERGRLPAYIYDDPESRYAADLQNLDAGGKLSYDDWVGRVATNPDCFKDTNAIDPSNEAANACRYVDSQAAIERLVPAGDIRRTGIVVTCPFIMYNYRAVVLP
jgi:hypothetical protein